jgi:hypothetical protein
MSDAIASGDLDPTSPAYVNARLYELEQFFQNMPALLEVFEGEFDAAESAHADAEAWAVLSADGANAAVREAKVRRATAETRKALLVAKAALRKAKATVKARSEEKDTLITRSVNLRREMELSGRGRP